MSQNNNVVYKDHSQKGQKMKKKVKKVIAISVIGLSLSLSGIGASGVSAQGNNGSPKPINITAEQEACLVSAKANIPTGPGRKASVKQAAKKCGIWNRFAKLSSAQQTCLATYGMSSPSGRPTKAQKSQLRSLAAKCGITLRVKG